VEVDGEAAGAPDAETDAEANSEEKSQAREESEQAFEDAKNKETKDNTPRGDTKNKKNKDNTNDNANGKFNTNDYNSNHHNSMNTQNLHDDIARHASFVEADPEFQSIFRHHDREPHAESLSEKGDQNYVRVSRKGLREKVLRLESEEREERMKSVKPVKKTGRAAQRAAQNLRMDNSVDPLDESLFFRSNNNNSTVNDININDDNDDFAGHWRPSPRGDVVGHINGNAMHNVFLAETKKPTKGQFASALKRYSKISPAVWSSSANNIPRAY
jgi:hypothetical protein